MTPLHPARVRLACGSAASRSAAMHGANAARARARDWGACLPSPMWSLGPHRGHGYGQMDNIRVGARKPYEDLKPKSPPYGGAHIDVRWQDKNEVGLAARAAASCRAPAPVPPSCIAITVHAAAPPFTTMQEKSKALTVRQPRAKFIRMKSASRKRSWVGWLAARAEPVRRHR